MSGYVYRPTIRFFEADQQRVVYHMWYLAYFEDARNELLASRGLSLRALQRLGFDLQVVHYDLDWLGPVRWEDELEIVASVVKVGNTSFRMGFAATVADREAVVAEAVYVVVDRANGSPVPMPKALADVFAVVTT